MRLNKLITHFSYYNTFNQHISIHVTTSVYSSTLFNNFSNNTNNNRTHSCLIYKKQILNYFCQEIQIPKAKGCYNTFLFYYWDFLISTLSEWIKQKSTEGVAVPWQSSPNESTLLLIIYGRHVRSSFLSLCYILSLSLSFVRRPLFFAVNILCPTY